VKNNVSVPERLLLAYCRHFPVQRGKLRLVNAAWRRVSGTAATSRIAVLSTGHRVTCDIAQLLQRQYYFFGTYWLERAELACWQAVARQSPTVFDVGANLGIYSLSARAANPDSTIHAFEPTPQHAAHLRGTLAANGVTGVHVHEAAVGGTSGEAVLNVSTGDLHENEGMNFITATPQAALTHPVRMTSLDDFCETHGVGRVDLVKMDVEGNERAVLDGARRLLAEGRLGTVFVELNWGSQPGLPCPATGVVDALSAHGFEFSEPRLPLRFRAPGSWLRACSNVVARQTPSVKRSLSRAI
jgi:FkbM family methyltransferase